jgi:hypothetical protein
MAPRSTQESSQEATASNANDTGIEDLDSSREGDEIRASSQMASKSTHWPRIIEAASSPFGLGALSVLGIVSILGADKFVDMTVAGVSMPHWVTALGVTLVALIPCVGWYVERRQGAPIDTVEHSDYIGEDGSCEIFLSAPMSSLEEAEYNALVDDLTLIDEALKERCEFEDVYCAAISAREQFTAPKLAARFDIQTVMTSRAFILILPEKTPSSVIFEAGIAFARGMRSLYFVPRRAELPFLMSELDEVFPDQVKVFTFETVDDIISHLVASDTCRWIRSARTQDTPKHC